MEKTYAIRNRFSGKIIFTLKCGSFQLCVQAAIAWGIKLDGASFKNASFKNASFEDASFKNASFKNASFEDASFDGASFYRASFINVKGLIFIQWAGFTMLIQKEKSKIGCEFRSNKEWLEMDIDKAVGLGIVAEHFESYRSLLRTSIEILMN